MIKDILFSKLVAFIQLGAGQHFFPELYLLINGAFLLLYLSIYAGRYVHNRFFQISYGNVTLYLAFAYYFSLRQVKFPRFIDYKWWFFHEDTFYYGLSNTIITSNYVYFFRTLIMLTALICWFISAHYFQSAQAKLFEYPILIVLSVVGCSLAISVFDLVAFYLSIELTSFCLYTLAASRYNSIYSVEAGTKYFIAGSAASVIYLFGSSMFFLISGTTNFDGVSACLVRLFASLLPQQQASSLEVFFYSFAITFTLVLPLFKVAAFPFHHWIADVYEGSPMAITAYFSIVIKLAMSLALIRFLYTALHWALFFLNWCFLILGVLTVIVGTLAALTEQKIKRVLAFSSISHSGYILLGLVPCTLDGTVMSLNYLLIYIVTNISIFTFLLVFTTKKKDANHRQIVFISDLALLDDKYNITSICFSAALLSFAGIPPFAGFFAKFGIFQQLWFAGHTITVLILIVMSLISTFYYLRFIKCLYFSPNVKRVFILSTNHYWFVSLVPIILLFFYAFFMDIFLYYLITLVKDLPQICCFPPASPGYEVSFIFRSGPR